MLCRMDTIPVPAPLCRLRRHLPHKGGDYSFPLSAVIRRHGKAGTEADRDLPPCGGDAPEGQRWVTCLGQRRKRNHKIQRMLRHVR
jgi:hypothetical protein